MYKLLFFSKCDEKLLNSLHLSLESRLPSPQLIRFTITEESLDSCDTAIHKCSQTIEIVPEERSLSFSVLLASQEAIFGLCKSPLSGIKTKAREEQNVTRLFTKLISFTFSRRQIRDIKLKRKLTVVFCVVERCSNGILRV